MWLLVGLGNPGSQYQHNRHNIGFMAVEAIARRHNFSAWKKEKKFQAEASEGVLAGEKVLLLMPQTYMNLSGQSVQAAAAFYKIHLDNIVVFHDELDLAPAKIRTKIGGGSAGHNGLKSIDAHLGPNFRRVRMGIGHPGDRDMVSAYVLGDFAKADDEWLNKIIDACGDYADLLVKRDMEGYMSKVSQVVAPPRVVKKAEADTNEGKQR